MRPPEGGSDLLDRFVLEVVGLGPKVGPLLVQLPPSLAFQAGIADRFLADLRSGTAGSVVCEPRHASWLTPDLDGRLGEFRVAWVAVDLARVARAGEPGSWRGLSYYRLHGSPRIYYSPYSSEALSSVADRLLRDAAAGAEA